MYKVTVAINIKGILNTVRKYLDQLKRAKSDRIFVSVNGFMYSNLTDEVFW